MHIAHIFYQEVPRGKLKMFDLEGDWSISFAGCGFLGIYYVGLVSCFLERAPFLLNEAKRMYGASSGALTATLLILGLPMTRCCEDLMTMAQAARRRSLGPLHPSCDLAKIVRDSLNRDLPPDAHILASGRLCVSLTRMSDGQNVLVSEFGSRQELIQALLCSCFIPGYFGLIPPSFRGVRYMDGALSNNQPQYQLKDTLTIAPFCGDCVICPRDEDPLSLPTVRVCSASYRVSLLNVRRIAWVFFPPGPQVMAEICQNGYRDGLQFLEENDLLSPPRLPAVLSAPEEGGTTPASCCGDEDEASQSWTNMSESSETLGGHWGLDRRAIDGLPLPIQQVLCEACREKHSLYTQVTGLLPVRMASYALLPYTLPVQSAFSMAQRLEQCFPALVELVQWLLQTCGDFYRQARKDFYRQAWETGSLEDSGEAPPTCSRDPSNSQTPPSTRCPATDTAPPPFIDFVTWQQWVTWAAEWMSPVSFEPTL